MDFTEFSVYGQRADLNRAIRDAELAASAAEIVHASRSARRTRLRAAFSRAGRALGRSLVYAGGARGIGTLRLPSSDLNEIEPLARSMRSSTIGRLR